MRLLGMLLALGAMGWVLYNASGSGESDTIIPESYQQSLDKAQGVEEMVKDAAEQRLDSLEDN
ncbi:MAG: hypothetical protein P8L70_03335 [Halioglobus sp.]|jgi:hypothetical protein|nr:hypothetical protein [Halieaceae bacterium]MDG1389686.1 hypothetical protein [Halioglobus sp.]MBT5007683.1 hypothetical protein [Halieaceae bacterium]MBT6123608.1 hypothetical protein [Halieaceae bacterium]MBT7718133.1 hypothetical protein [Halieaceae bacterium]